MVIGMRKLYSICLISLCICMFLVMGISVDATTIEEILGEKTTIAMLDEIITEVNSYSTITKEQINEIIEDITNTYGLELTPDELADLYDMVAARIDSKVTDNITLLDRIKMWVSDLRRIVEETFPEVKDKEVTVTIPRISQVDALINEGIYYFVRNILPLITS